MKISHGTPIYSYVDAYRHMQLFVYVEHAYWLLYLCNLSYRYLATPLVL